MDLEKETCIQQKEKQSHLLVDTKIDFLFLRERVRGSIIIFSKKPSGTFSKVKNQQIPCDVTDNLGCSGYSFPMKFI